MKSNKTYLLAFIFIALAVIAYFITADRGERTATYKIKEKQFFTIDSASVDKFTLERNGKKVTLSKVGTIWRVTEPVDYPAFSQFIMQAIANLKRYKIESRVSDNPSNKDKFGFNDTNYLKLTVFQGGNQLGVMLIGGMSPGAAQTFVKKTDSDEIFLASEFVRNDFVKEDFVNDWRDKIIVSIPRNKMKSIEFISSSDNYKIEMDSSGKYISGKDSLNTAVLDGVLNMFQSLNTQSYIDSAVNFTKFDKTIRIQADRLYEFGFVKAGEDPNPKFMLKVSDMKQVFLVDENFVKMAFKPRKEVIVGK